MNKVKHTISWRIEEMRDGEEKSEEVDMEAKQLLEKFRELVCLSSILLFSPSLSFSLIAILIDTFRIPSQRKQSF